MTCVHRHHHSQQLGVESLVHSKKRSNFLFKCIERGAVELQRLPKSFLPDAVTIKIKIRQHPATVTACPIDRPAPVLNLLKRWLGSVRVVLRAALQAPVPIARPPSYPSDLYATNEEEGDLGNDDDNDEPSSW